MHSESSRRTLSAARHSDAGLQEQVAHSTRMSARLQHNPHAPADALSNFMYYHSAPGEWYPEAAAAFGGASPPRRRPGPLRQRHGHQRSYPPPALPSTDSGEPMQGSAVAPANPTITVSDDQLRRAFGPSPIFGGSGIVPDECRPPPVLLRPSAPTPTRQASESTDVQAELEAMKNLSVEEMLTVFKGSPTPSRDGSPAPLAMLPTAPPASPLPSPPFDDTPWKRAVVGGRLDYWPPLPPGPPPVRAHFYSHA